MTDAIFWSVDDVATYYGISRRVVYHHIQKGALEAIYVGGALRISREAALNYGKPVQPSQSSQLHQQPPTAR